MMHSLDPFQPGLSPFIPLPTYPRVAAYVRVSHGDEGMLHSMHAQIEYYTDAIREAPNWEFAGIYVDADMSYGQNAKSS